MLTAAERAQLAAFRVPWRRADWLVGRITAKVVVAEAVGQVFPGPWPLSSIEIASHVTGMPYARVAPEGQPLAGFAPGQHLPVSVTISHIHEQALCAATCDGPGGDGRVLALGIDLGVVEPRSRALIEDYFTDEERRFVRDGPEAERELRANLIWCAKEAVLKALGLGLTVDTRELSCRPENGLADRAEWLLAPADAGWQPFQAACSPALLPGGGTIRGIWRAFPGLVGTLASCAAPGRSCESGARPPRLAGPGAAIAPAPGPC